MAMQPSSKKQVDCSRPIFSSQSQPLPPFRLTILFYALNIHRHDFPIRDNENKDLLSVRKRQDQQELFRCRDLLL